VYGGIFDKGRKFLASHVYFPSPSNVPVRGVGGIKGRRNLKDLSMDL
jgi:hypothetical protein